MWCRPLIYEKIVSFIFEAIYRWYAWKLERICSKEVELVRKRDTYTELCDKWYSAYKLFRK